MSFIQNPNLSPDLRIFLKIHPNPFVYKILRSVTTLQIFTKQAYTARFNKRRISDKRRVSNKRRGF